MNIISVLARSLNLRGFLFLLALIKGVANELLNRYNPTAVANLIPTELIYSILNYTTLL